MEGIIAGFVDAIDIRVGSMGGPDFGVAAGRGGGRAGTYRGPGLGLVASELRRRVRSGAGQASMFDAMEIVLPIGEVVCASVVGS